MDIHQIEEHCSSKMAYYFGYTALEKDWSLDFNIQQNEIILRFICTASEHICMLLLTWRPLAMYS
mgnify:CR=1 FL=1